MSGEKSYETVTADEKLQYHLNNINRYIESSNCNYSSYQEEFKIYADMTVYDLNKKTSDELFNIAFILYSYVAYLQDEINKHKTVLAFCESELNSLMAKHRSDYGFDKYTKHEMRRSTIIFENSHAAKLEEIRLSASNKLTLLDGKVYELKRQAEILLEKSKRK